MEPPPPRLPEMVARGCVRSHPVLGRARKCGSGQVSGVLLTVFGGSVACEIVQARIFIEWARLDGEKCNASASQMFERQVLSET